MIDERDIRGLDLPHANVNIIPTFDRTHSSDRIYN